MYNKHCNTANNRRYSQQNVYNFCPQKPQVAFKNTETQDRLNESNIEANTEHVSHFVTTEIMCPQVKLLCHGDRATWCM
jgi:hypothetical protein